MASTWGDSWGNSTGSWLATWDRVFTPPTPTPPVLVGAPGGMGPLYGKGERERKKKKKEDERRELHNRDALVTLDFW